MPDPVWNADLTLNCQILFSSVCLFLLFICSNLCNLALVIFLLIWDQPNLCKLSNAMIHPIPHAVLFGGLFKFLAYFFFLFCQIDLALAICLFM